MTLGGQPSIIRDNEFYRLIVTIHNPVRMNFIGDSQQTLFTTNGGPVSWPAVLRELGVFWRSVARLARRLTLHNS